MTSLQIDIKEIQQLIPHRYPFLLIDRIEQVELGASAIGIKNVSINEWYFQGHFPAHPIFPGVLIIEAMAQTAAALVVKTLKASQEAESQAIESKGISPERNDLVYFMSIDEAKFRKPVSPGDILQLKVIKKRSRGKIWQFQGTGWVKDSLVAEAIFTAMIVEQ